MDSLALLKREGVGVGLARTRVRVVGIDPGTTNSTVAEILWDPGQSGPVEVRCLEIDQDTTEGRYTHVLVPSVVALHQGKVHIGEGAKRLRARAAGLGIEETRNLFSECKNDIGIKRTYHRAPMGFQSAAEVGGHVLRFLKDSATSESPAPADRVVVTVPASSQAAQRRDTLKAPERARIPLGSGDLLELL
jgi:molecular chaperone DnaK (HSP70)